MGNSLNRKSDIIVPTDKDEKAKSITFTDWKKKQDCIIDIARPVEVNVDENILKINDEGNITGVNPGKAIVTIKIDDKSAECEITVVNDYVVFIIPSILHS